ncbi:MAG: DUF3073 domain-containing protein [Actinomycetota bacterium]|nr:DUF3073 domain-containing protein [Actinomycetota bacterium]
MGRGRSKAKQTKVARDLKYRTHETDFGALARELHGEEANEASREAVDVDGTAGEPAGEATGGIGEYDEWTDYPQPSRGD